MAQIWESAVKRPYGLLAVLCLALFLQGLFTVPALDRDEARFAQASKQMIETGDLVDVRFQGEPRHKKPVGIYWLQAASASLLGAPPYDHIWPYRLPSLVGAVLAVWLTFWAGRPLVGDRAALIGAALLAATLMLGIEAKLAKTDAVLLATIVAAQGALARIALRTPPAPLSLVLVFWGALGLGTLVKGPIAFLVIALTAVTLALWNRDRSLLTRLRPLLGFAIVAVVVLPWAVSAYLATHGQFFHDAIAGDLVPKLKGGQESHGAPPGTYLLLAFVTFWPGTLVLAPALVHAWGRRSDAGLRFLLAWVGPAWLVFELVPTKLPHYVLPLYPALALLCGAVVAAAESGQSTPLNGLLGRLALIAWAVVATALAVFLAVLDPLLTKNISVVAIVLALAVLVSLVPVVQGALRGRTTRAVVAAIIVSALVQCAAFSVVAPRLTSLWVSTRVAALLPFNPQGHHVALAASGFAEPSLVFAAGTRTVLGRPEEAVTLLASDPTAYAAIAEPQKPAFEAAARARGMAPRAVATIAGFNYSVGKPVTLTLYRNGTKDSPP